MGVFKDLLEEGHGYLWLPSVWFILISQFCFLNLLGFNGVNTVLIPTVAKGFVGPEQFQAQSWNTIEPGEMLSSCK